MSNVSSAQHSVVPTTAFDDLGASEQSLERLRDTFTALARSGSSESDWWDDAKRDFQCDVMRAYRLLERLRASTGTDAADLRAGVIALVRELESDLLRIKGQS